MYKFVIRNDDVGYSDVCNIGTFETFYNGYSTSADVMLDAPGAVDALERLRELPWISVGWHTHFWHAPILGAERCPSLVIPETGRFKHRDELYLGEDVSFDEALAEMHEELTMCMDILGRAPDVAEAPRGDSPFARAMRQVIEEYGMATNFGHRMQLRPDGKFDNGPVDPKWEDAQLYIIDQRGIVAGDIIVPTFKEQLEYDTGRFLLEDRMRLNDLPEGSAIMHGFHPGYVDYHVAKLGDYGPNMCYYTVSRTYDVEGLCSQRLHDWIKENKIMLCNIRDVLYGTQEYQNHLRHIGSDLCML